MTTYLWRCNWGRVARAYIAGVFLLAAVGKAADPMGFADRITSLGWVDSAHAAACALLLVAAEVAVGVLVLVPRSANAAGGVAGLMGLGFLVANGVLLFQGRPRDCPCFGVLFSLPVWATAVLDVGLVGAGLCLRCGRLGVERSGAVTDHASRSSDAGTGICNSGSRVPVLVFVLSVCVFVFVQVLPRDPILHAALSDVLLRASARREAEALERARAADPPLGTRLPIPPDARAAGTIGLRDRAHVPSRDPRARLVHAPSRDRRLTLVMVIGECSSCALPLLRDAAGLDQAHPGVRVVGVSLSLPGQLWQFKRRHGLLLDLRSDPSGKTLKLYNAAWVPRAYLLTDTGVLLWIQPTRDGTLNSVARTLSERGI